MKNNRKNRKAKYINTKNRLRTGGALNLVVKISKELMDDSEDFEAIIIDDARSTIEKDYKIPVECVHVHIGQINDDFIKNIHRCRLVFKSKLYTAIRA